MAEPVISPIGPAAGSQREAVAASTAAVYTAEDRKIIEERTGGEEMRTRSFLDVLKDKPITPAVENEETAVHPPQQNAKAVASRFDEHQKMLRNSPIVRHKDQVIITGQLPDTYQDEEENSQALSEEEEKDKTETTPAPLIDKTEKISKEQKEAFALAKELKFNPLEIFDKFNLEQKELFSLITRLRELHLKRLLSESAGEFESLSQEITRSSLSSAKPGEETWLTNQLNRLSLEAATYKLGILKSLQNIEFSKGRENDIKWLQTEIKKLGHA